MKQEEEVEMDQVVEQQKVDQVEQQKVDQVNKEEQEGQQMQEEMEEEVEAEVEEDVEDEVVEEVEEEMVIGEMVMDQVINYIIFVDVQQDVFVMIGNKKSYIYNIFVRNMQHLNPNIEEKCLQKF